MLRLMVLLVLGAVTAASASAQQLLKVVQPVWTALTQEEKDSVQKRFLVEVAQPESFGVIIDTQGVDESTQGTTAGAALGSAIGSAMYVDRAFNNQNYSAKSHLGAVLLGGLLGSALDAKPVQQFHYRYAVRFLNGNINYFDVVSSDPFRHPVGVCVAVPAVFMLPDQGLCTQTVALFRSTYLGTPAPALSASQPATVVVVPQGAPVVAPTEPAGAAVMQAVSAPGGPAPSPELVFCKLNTLAPVRTTAEKCTLINGRIVNE